MINPLPTFLTIDQYMNGGKKIGESLEAEWRQTMTTSQNVIGRRDEIERERERECASSTSAEITAPIEQ